VCEALCTQEENSRGRGWIRKLLKGDLSRKRFREVAEDNPLVVENLAKKYPTLTREIAMRKYLDVLKKKCS
jgi:hypothetical protein